MRTFLGGLLAAIGILILTLTGMCTLALAVATLRSGFAALGGLGVAIVPLFIGGGILAAGLELMRDPKREIDDDPRFVLNHPPEINGDDPRDQPNDHPD